MRKKKWPNINSTQRYGQVFTHAEAKAANIIPALIYTVQWQSPLLFSKQKARQERDQRSKLPSAGSMVDPDGQWHSAMTELCLGSSRIALCGSEKTATGRNESKTIMKTI